MMLTELEALVQELQSEKERLNEELQECLQFQDYRYAAYYQKGIWRIDRKIQRLLSMNQQGFKRDTQHIADALIDLHENLIEGFSLSFPRQPDFRLDFSKTRCGKLQLAIPSEEEMQNAHHYFYISSFQNHLLAMGFEYHDERICMEFELEENKSCDGILAKLAILLFDVLRFETNTKGYISKKYITT